MFHAFPWLRQYFDARVPDEMVTWDASDGLMAVFPCPCGVTMDVRVARCIDCDGDGCGRFYLATSKSVLVANSPNSPHRIAP